MDNPLIAVASVLAVALLVLINWALGGWRRAKLSSPDQAKELYLADHWTDTPGDVCLDAERRVALISLQGEAAVGLVYAMGDKFVSRRLSPGSVQSFTCKPQNDGCVIQLKVTDFAFPALHITLNTDDAAHWIKRLEALQSQKEPAHKAVNA